MTTNTESQVHVRDGEITASLSVALNKLAEAGKLDVSTFWSKDDHGFANHVAVTEVMWDASDGHKSLIVLLENGEEFEFVARRSSKALRNARRELENEAHRLEKEGR